MLLSMFWPTLRPLWECVNGGPRNGVLAEYEEVLQAEFLWQNFSLTLAPILMRPSNITVLVTRETPQTTLTHIAPWSMGGLFALSYFLPSTTPSPIWASSCRAGASMWGSKLAIFNFFHFMAHINLLLKLLITTAPQNMFFSNLTKVGIILIHSHWTSIVVLAAVVFFYLII